MTQSLLLLGLECLAYIATIGDLPTSDLVCELKIDSSALFKFHEKYNWTVYQATGHFSPGQQLLFYITQNNFCFAPHKLTLELDLKFYRSHFLFPCRSGHYPSILIKSVCARRRHCPLEVNWFFQIIFAILISSRIADSELSALSLS